MFTSRENTQIMVHQSYAGTKIVIMEKCLPSNEGWIKSQNYLPYSYTYGNACLHMGTNWKNVNKWRQLTHEYMIVDYCLPFKYFSYCHNAVCAGNTVSKIIMASAQTTSRVPFLQPATARHSLPASPAGPVASNPRLLTPPCAILSPPPQPPPFSNVLILAVS